MYKRSRDLTRGPPDGGSDLGCRNRPVAITRRGRRAAARRADWDKGDYVAALTTYQELLAGPDAAAVLEPIALQTGELFRTTELTTDGANPGLLTRQPDLLLRDGPRRSGRRRVGRGTHHARPRGGRPLDGRHHARRRRGELLPRRTPRRVPARAGVGRAHARPGSGRRARRPRPNARRARRPWRASSRAPDGSSCATSAAGATRRSTPATC